MVRTSPRSNISAEMNDAHANLDQQTPRDVLGSDTLKNIEDHKSFLAEMRPNRRKIKWNAQVADWDKCQHASQSRITDLSLEDLQIHGRVPIAAPKGPEETKKSAQPKLGDQIDVIEKNIRRCYKTIKRVSKEAAKSQERAKVLQEENRNLRRAIMSTSTSHVQTTRQSCKQLALTIDAMKRSITEMDDQINMLRMRRDQLYLEAKQFRSRKESKGTEDDEDSVAKYEYEDYSRTPSTQDSFSESKSSEPSMASLSAPTITRRMSATPRAA